MIRKFMVGAVAAAMPLALLSTGAGAAAAKPTITGVSVSAAVEGNVNGGLYPGGNVGYQNTVTITVTGTNLDTTKMDKTGANAVSISPEAGWTAFLGVMQNTWTINSVTGKSSTGFTFNATAPNITLSLLGGGGYPTKAGKMVTITGGGASAKTGTFTLGSNCGPVPTTGDPAVNLPINNRTGVAYADGDFGTGTGKQPLIFKDYFKSLPSAYTDIMVVSTGLLGAFAKPPLLCSADLGLTPPITATSTFGYNGYYGWAKNYGVYANGKQLPAVKQTGNAVTVKVGKVTTPGNATFGGMSFALPITTVGGVNVKNSVIKYGIPKNLTVTACAAESASDGSASTLKTWSDAQGAGVHKFFRDQAQTTCAVTDAGKTITVTDAADRFFDEGTFLNAPSIKLTGVAVKSAGTYNFTLVGTTSTISLGGNDIDITFNPEPKSKSITAPLFSLVITS